MRIVKNKEFEWNGMGHSRLTLGGILPTFGGNNSRKPPFSEHRLYSNGKKKSL